MRKRFGQPFYILNHENLFFNFRIRELSSHAATMYMTVSESFRRNLTLHHIFSSHDDRNPLSFYEPFPQDAAAVRRANKA